MFKRLNLLLLQLAFILSGAGTYAQKYKEVKIGDPGIWVTGVAANLEARPLESELEGVYYLLLDKQTHVTNQARYFHCVYRITSVDGLQENADISVTFDPSYEQLTFHEVKIIREGEVHDQLHPAGIKVVQNEQQMDRYLYDNSLTAVLHLRDLRVGDIVEYSFTRNGFNPVFQGHYSEQFYFQYAMPYEKGHFRLVTPKSKNFSFDYKFGEGRPTTSSSANSNTYTWNFEKMQGLRYENNTPAWYIPNYRVLVTDYESWDEVNKWALTHYTLNSSDQMKLQAGVGSYFSGDNKKATALNVIRFVQDEVRYLGFEDGVHSHMPHPPLQVYQQRYGDCKDKSMLLCALLACYDIEANPVLVNSSLRYKVSELLPAISSFDHVIAQIILDGDTSYVDPTISNQGGEVGTIYFPDYKIGCVVHPQYGGLRNIDQQSTSKIEEENMFSLKQKGEGASLMVNTRYFGVEADIIRQRLAGTRLENLQETYTDYYTNLYAATTSEYPMKVVDDRDKNVLHITEYYDIPQIWDIRENQHIAEFYPLGMNDFTNIPKSTHRRQAPYLLNYPTHFEHETIIRLPEFWNVTEDVIEIEHGEYRYYHSVRYTNNEIRLIHTYKTLSSYVDAEHIERFVNDHQTIRDNLSFQLTYDENFAWLEESSATPAIVLTILSLLFGVWLMVKIYYYDREPTVLVEPHNELPIGGWLVLFAIGVVVTPFALIYQLFIVDLFFNPEQWMGFTQLSNIPYSIFMSLQLVFNVFLLLFSTTFAILFFQRRSTVPRIVSLKYIVHFALLMLIMLFGAFLVDEIEYSNREWFDLVKIVGGGAIWIWYFSVSQRVSKTFVRRVYKSPASVE